MHSVSLRGNEDSSETFQIFNYAFEGLMLLRPMWISYSLHSFNKLKSMMSLLFYRSSCVEERGEERKQLDASVRGTTDHKQTVKLCRLLSPQSAACTDQMSLCCNDTYVILPSLEPNRISHVFVNRCSRLFNTFTII